MDTNPYPEYMNAACDFENMIGIPIYEYVVDADFDRLCHNAFYGINRGDTSLNICEMFIKPFMDRFVFAFIYS
jgi:hypothetical protein